MSVANPMNLAASVKQRLLNRAKVEGREFNSLLTQFALERFLFRISVSGFKDRFILKGALLFNVWLGRLARSTQDADFLHLDRLDIPALIKVFQEICRIDAEADGIRYLGSSVEARVIREDNPHGGIRIILTAVLGKARIPLQFDVGYGDAVFPKEVEIVFPSLLDFSAPRLKSYRKEGMIAEKFHAAVTLGMRNSRMKDYFDILPLCRTYSFEGAAVSEAIAATFKKQKTPIPRDIPAGLSMEFAEDRVRKIQWRSFVVQVGVDQEYSDFEMAVKKIAEFLMPPELAAAAGRIFKKHWPAGGPWRDVHSRGDARVTNQRKKL